MEQEETIASLQKHIYRLTKEEKEHVVTQNRVFAHLCKRVPHTVLDKQLLCLIDYYESKLRKFHTQRQCKKDDSQSEEKDHRNLYASPSYKSLLMLQNQLKESKSKIDTLLGENLSLQKDLENRPTEHELKLYKQQVKKLEKALKKSIKLQEIIGQKKVDDMEKKDEPPKDSRSISN
ncbi:centrosomal protein of 70 kDa-like [Peromyscus leucopus]|uniref:centrosomal protein of 70 kDa-like n=1 Tax=Peromyscus leucopus TaxID=10041 RepID=UPI0018859CE3|nr:centrosomal protein of 70 kDa-like [Peromyscus leucopus]